MIAEAEVGLAAASDAENALADLQDLMGVVFARARTLWKESAASLHPDLQVAGYKLLTYIDQAGTASAHHLAERFDMDKSVVSRQVRMLEDLGLLESRPDERDGRLRVLSVTPQASTALRTLRHDYAVRMRAGIGALTAEEIRAASKVLALLAEV